MRGIQNKNIPLHSYNNDFYPSRLSHCKCQPKYIYVIIRLLWRQKEFSIVFVTIMFQPIIFNKIFSTNRLRKATIFNQIVFPANTSTPIAKQNSFELRPTGLVAVQKFLKFIAMIISLWNVPFLLFIRLQILILFCNGAEKHTFVHVDIHAYIHICQTIGQGRNFLNIDLILH